MTNDAPFHGDISPQEGMDDTTILSREQELEATLRERDLRLRDVLEKHKLALEEFEKAKDRTRREERQERDRRVKGVLTDFIDVLDDLERALAAGSRAPDPAGVLRGVEMVRGKFLAKLAAHGAQPIDSEGASFDPRIHEAVATVPVRDPALEGRIVAVSRTGYAIGDEVLRPAQVAVGKLAAGGFSPS